MTKRITPLAGKPLTASVEGEELVIRIGVGSLALSVMEHEFWPDHHAIVDAGAFARMVAEALPISGKALDLFGSLSLWTGDEAAEVLKSAAVSSGSPEEASERILAQTRDRLPDHIEEIRGALHRQDAKGNWVAEDVLKAQDMIADDLVRQFVDGAKSRAGNLADFRDEALAAVTSMNALLDQQYDVTFGGAKGNVTLTTIHPTMRMEVRVSDLIAFGPELKQAKALIDECLSAWSHDAHPMIRALVNNAFNVEKEGRANRGALLSMLRYEVDDPRWQRAMQALRDSIRVDGTKTYVRFQERDTIDSAWRTIALDIARA